jgi:hypothetical protein
VTLEIDYERYRAAILNDWYRRNRVVIESLDEQASFSSDYGDDHLSACLWSLQRAAQSLDLALRERR